VAAEGTSVYISIVTAILLYRRICTATRGCTSRAVGGEPQVFRMPCSVILGTRALVMQRSKLRGVKFLGSGTLPWRVVNGGLVWTQTPQTYLDQSHALSSLTNSWAVRQASQ
jgi:hypothetical protein